MRDGGSVTDHYWALVLADIHGALDMFAPLFHDSRRLDGYVSVEVDPGLAHDGAGTEAAARALHQRVDRPNLMVKIPGTVEALPAIEQMIAEGRNINVTLIFSLDRYQKVMDAYLDGLERLASDPQADLAEVASVASFFISRVDTEVDARLGSRSARLRRWHCAAQQRSPRQLLPTRPSYAPSAVPGGMPWPPRGAMVQRPLWASTSTKNPAYPDTLYVDTAHRPRHRQHSSRRHCRCIRRPRNPGPHDRRRGRGGRSPLAGPRRRRGGPRRRGGEARGEGVASFQASFDDLLVALAAKAEELATT